MKDTKQKRYMKKIYISRLTCEAIQKAVIEKRFTYKDIAKQVNSSTSTICRICTGKTKNIDLCLAQKIEKVLNVKISNALDDNEELIKIIENLEEENKLLKLLLIERWQL